MSGIEWPQVGCRCCTNVPTPQNGIARCNLHGVELPCVVCAGDGLTDSSCLHDDTPIPYSVTDQDKFRSNHEVVAENAMVRTLLHRTLAELRDLAGDTDRALAGLRDLISDLEQSLEGGS